MKKWILLTGLTLGIWSCAELNQVVQVMNQNTPLTETEVINGLKEALMVGTDTAVFTLSKTDGYFGNQLYKILLPPEADVIVKNASKIPGGTKLINDAVLSINRAAEDAAKSAAPVFISAIRQMTIQDAWNILKGKENAATEFLQRTTYNQLFELYNPKIKTSLNKPLAAGVSGNETWNLLTGQWNKMAETTVGKIAGFNPVKTDLDNYLTEKALNGLFLKIAEEEKNIRQDPMARVTLVLKRVFGTN
jgi:hypothetical protein